MSKRSLTMSLTALLALSSLVLAACSPPAADDDAADPEEVDVEDPDAGIDEEAPPEPSEPTVLRTVFNREMTSLDFHGMEGLHIPHVQAGRHIFDPLVKREANEFAPALAVDWGAIDDTTWEITIRDDVHFHNDEPVTAADVVASFDEVLSHDSPLSGFFAGIVTVEAIDEHSIRIDTDRPKGDMMTALEMLLVAPADQVGTEEFHNNPVGSGAFVFAEWSPGDVLVLERNTDYWGEMAGVDQLEFYDVPEAAARVTGVITGELDVIFDIGPEDVETLEAADGVSVITGPAWPYYKTWPNHGVEPFDDVRVRKALWHAIDSETMVDSLLPGLAEVQRAPVSSSAVHAGDFEPYEYDPDLARELLEEAGYPDGFETSIQWPSGDGPQIREVATTFASYWNAIGIEVELLEREAGVWGEHFGEATYEINLMAHSGSQGDAASVLGRLYHSDEHRLGYGDEQTDALIENARTEVDVDEQAQAWRDVQARLWEEAVAIWTLDLYGAYAVRDGVENFEPSPDASRPLFHNATIGNQ